MTYLARRNSNLISKERLNKLFFCGNWHFMDNVVRLSRNVSILKFLLTARLEAFPQNRRE